MACGRVLCAGYMAHSLKETYLMCWSWENKGNCWRVCALDCHRVLYVQQIISKPSGVKQEHLFRPWVWVSDVGCLSLIWLIHTSADQLADGWSGLILAGTPGPLGSVPRVSSFSILECSPHDHREQNQKHASTFSHLFVSELLASHWPKRVTWPYADSQYQVYLMGVA